MQTTSVLIGGAWVPAARSVPNLNPARPDEVIGEYGWCDAAQAAAAIDAARAALPAWSATLPDTRAAILRRVAQELSARAEDLGRLLSREEGKTLPEGIGEIRRAAAVIDYFAGEAFRTAGHHLPGLREGFEVVVTRAPVGVVAAITPWNFPMVVPAWKCAAAIVYGNTVVLKPSEYTPACAWELADIFHRAGLPGGVLNLVGGDGRAVGPALIAGADAISFTGAGPTGRVIMAQAAPLMKKVQLELGGKNPLVVAADADLDLAVQVALDGAFFASGQRCTASSRLVVEAPVHDAFVERLTAAVAGLKPGDPLLPEIRIGPVANAVQRDKVLDYIAIGRAEGAEVATGGHAVETNTGGYFVAPTLFTRAHNAMRICREEIFGPVAAVIRADDLDHAFAIANDTEFGLSSGIVTRSLAAATAFRRISKAGMVMVNAPTAGVDFHVPFGGRDGSGFGGGEQGLAAIQFFTETRTHYINPGRP
ncbi:aldehyde dehydrogenase family protein [Ruixingdingia sedimenti]|uniref:Aldehyde dehydrogenase family protein n=1 Tax=Ruixingdingia sedimenti TaxID=3073604 RepID=A0ABU1F8I8_9RHOB|nr:aldehyde dehydrogenase family protein [Xinfangfangia sp. LG-4]MDR5652779.1 aldehyde dehydrogenase family protein [Xinfangfangia sp. LG-4]